MQKKQDAKAEEDDIVASGQALATVRRHPLPPAAATRLCTKLLVLSVSGPVGCRLYSSIHAAARELPQMRRPACRCRLRGGWGWRMRQRCWRRRGSPPGMSRARSRGWAWGPSSCRTTRWAAAWV